jgi:hypothetical protein
MELKCPNCSEDILIADEELKEKQECPFCLQAFAIELEPPPVIESPQAVHESVTSKGTCEYKAVPFIGLNKDQLNTHEMALQLESQINNQARDGWEFVQHADVQVMVQPGCLGTFLLQKPTVHHVNQLIFRRSLD